MAAAGDKINGFTLIRQLGAGGMGETWEAVRLVGAEFEQRVAIKIAVRDTLQTAEGLELFRREASLAASLRHPNIAAVLDVDEHLGCIICELVDGADLRAVLRVSPRARLDAPVLVYVLGQIARGLSHAHRRLHHGRLSPVVHRDMSPGNVVADYDGNLKIVDFGIAKAIASADISETIKGKLSYMAPEQAMGSRIDGRVDQYALGVMAYEALAGVRPNDGAHDGETLANILSGKRITLMNRGCRVPKGLADVIEKMLAVDPERRFPSMDAVITALDPFTPPLTVHRQLAELVLRARPAQTIVMQNGRFVSQPVAQESLRREPTPDSRRNARREHSNLAATDPAAPRDPGAHTHTQPASSKNPSPLPPPFPATAHAFAGRPGAASDSTAGRPSALPREREESGTSSPARPQRTRGRGQAVLAAAGALLLGLSSWWVFSAGQEASRPGEITNKPGADERAEASLAPSLPEPHAATEEAAAKELTAVPSPEPSPHSGGEVAAVELDARQSTPSDRRSATDDRPRKASRNKHRDHDRDEPKSAEIATAHRAATASALARVKVFPWGRVWIDGKLEGSVPPILEVQLTPGTHEIAVGHERPMETRRVELKPGTTLVSFDLEGR